MSKYRSRKMAFYAANDIFYYDDSDAAVGGCVSGDVSDVARELIEAANIPHYAEQNRPAYEYGAAQAGIPWQALAAIHWREAGLQSNKSIADGEPLGSGISIDGQAIGDTLAEDAVTAARKALDIGRAVYGVDISASDSAEDFARAFLAYNRPANKSQ
jgi:hypothetical protein